MKRIDRREFGINRREFGLRAAATAALPLTPFMAAPAAVAQGSYPTQPVKLVVPFAAGGGGDALGRLLAEALRPTLGQPIVVENKPGAGTVIASEAVARAAPDGHTVLLNNSALILNAFLNDSLPYKPLDDFVPVVEMVKAQLWLAVSVARTDARNVNELIAHMKKDAALRFYATAGNGSLGHLLGYNLSEREGLGLKHVSYKGAAPAATDLAAGQIPMAILDLVPLKPLLDAGKVRLIAVTGTARSAMQPEVATFGEAGFEGFTAYSWAGLFMPSKTPQAAVHRLAQETVQVLARPDIVEKLRLLGYDAGTLAEARFADTVKADSAYWGNLIRKAGIKS